MSKRKFKLKGFMSAMLVLLVLALVVGAICHFTRIDDNIVDLFNPTFRVEYNGVEYTGKDNKIVLPKGEQAKFIVKSISGYKVTIKPNVTADTDFTYTVDGVEHKYSETNLTKAFLSQDNMQSGYFTLNAIDDYSLESVLSKVYEGQTVVLYQLVSKPYLLTIATDNNEVSFVFGDDVKVDNISLDCASIIF